jgi:hypothetical protein
MSLQAVVNSLPLETKKTMHILLSPVFANVIWIGGGSVGLLVVIVILVLLFR